MGQETQMPFEQPEGLDFTPPKADFLEKTTPATTETFEEFKEREEQRHSDREEISRYGTPEGKVDFRKMTESYPTTIPESFGGDKDPVLTREEMDLRDARARKRRLN